jgi:hypothetical protein
MTAFWCSFMVCTGWVMGCLTAPNVPAQGLAFLKYGFYLNHFESDVMDIQKGRWEEVAGRVQG